MGIDTNIYIGPYVELTTGVSLQTINTCNKQDCPEPKKGFCSTCGKKASERQTKKKMDDVDGEQYDYDFHEFTDYKLIQTHWMSDPDVVKGKKTYRLVSNETTYDHISGEIDVCDLRDIDAKEELSSFSKDMKKYLKQFEEMGFEVAVKWGFVRYYS